MGRAAPPVDPVEIEVISYNTWAVPFPFSPGGRRDRLAGASAWMAQHDAEIVGLQELFGRSRGYLDPGAGTTLLADSDVETGLALLSALPVQERSRELFAPERQVDILTRKGFIHATVTLDNGVELAVFVTHLEAGLAFERRQRAARRLLQAVAAAEGPAVVLGDFNLSEDQRDRDIEQRFAQAGWRDAGAEGDPTHRLFDERFDRIYLVNGPSWCTTATDFAVLGEAQGVDERWSDHRPVWARLRIERCEPEG
jgi:endonuclease/exonuclease/phosphatase family metal-dependent hydrolase